MPVLEAFPDKIDIEYLHYYGFAFPLYKYENDDFSVSGDNCTSLLADSSQCSVFSIPPSGTDFQHKCDKVRQKSTGKE